MLSSTFISSFSSNLCTVDASSALTVDFVSSIITIVGTVVVLDCLRDAIGGVISLSCSIGSGVFALFCCLFLICVRDEIGGTVGLTCSIGSGVCAVFCCLCDGLSLLFFSHEEG